MERFNTIYLVKSTEYGILPHPLLGWVSPNYIEEQERYLNHFGENRANKIYVVALGGSTTETGYPAYTEQYLNRKLEEANSSLSAVVFNFGVGAWNSIKSLQNYAYVVRYLHPDFAVIHHNFNDVYINRQAFQQSVIDYPQISPWERTLIRHSRIYTLLKFTYLLAYNPIRYGRTIPCEEIFHSSEAEFSIQSRISSYINSRMDNLADPWMAFKVDFGERGQPNPELPLRNFLLTEIYGSLIGYTRADNSTLIMTTQYLNVSKRSEFLDFNEPREINDLIRNISKKHNAPLADLDREMEQYDNLLQEDGVHFQEEGIKIKGELIGEAIFEILKERYNLTD